MMKNNIKIKIKQNMNIKYGKQVLNKCIAQKKKKIGVEKNKVPLSKIFQLYEK